MFGKRLPVFVSALLFAALALSTPRPAAADDGYTVTDLGALPGKPYSAPWQQTINNAGVVVAYANASALNLFNNVLDGDSAYLWQKGTITPLPGLPGATDTIPEHINNNGTVVGRSTPAGSPNQPVLWDQGVIQVLPELPGDDKGSALTINDRGQAAGNSANSVTGFRRAVLWQKGTVSQLTPVPGGGAYDDALGINEKGQIVGWSGPGPGQEHIAFWDKDGSVHDLGTLGGAFGDAYQINNKGQVVGTSATASNPNGDPFLWDNGVLTDLGYPAGDVFGVAADINHKGQIVGLSASNPSDPTTYHALLWKDGKMTDLQTKIPADSGWQLVWALGINERGQIVGAGLHNGNFRAYLLTPK
jgi:probable HAF family extracellular repeat protein